MLRYLVGSAIGGKLGLCPIWQTKPLLYGGIEYYAEIVDGVLSVRRGGDNFHRANAEQAWRKASDLVGQARRFRDDMSSQVAATEEARDGAAADLERSTVQQREQAKKILESWELTLEEIRPRLGEAEDSLAEAEEEFRLTMPPVASSPECFTFDLSSIL